MEDVSSSPGRPFQAKKITASVTYRTDISQNTRVTKSNLFRDSRGRIRIERFYDGTQNPSEAVPSDIIIVDDCGNSASLFPAVEAAQIGHLHLSSDKSDQPICEEFDPKKTPDLSPTGLFEILGHRSIGAVEVRGERVSYYSSVQEKLSGSRPISIHETWCSVSLDTAMDFLILSDSPKAEITTVFSDVILAEPDPQLFEIPDGYRVVQSNQSTPTPKK